MFRVNEADGLVQDARQVCSPNQDERPPGCLPELIVVHGISLPPRTFGGPHIDQLFTNGLSATEHPSFAAIYNVKVSAHFLIRRCGELVQYVPIHMRAWHAGISSFSGRAHCNDYSVGIELEGDDYMPYAPSQYDGLARLIRTLQVSIPSLAGAGIVGHCDIAPGRKTDPGPAFDWQQLDALLRRHDN